MFLKIRFTLACFCDFEAKIQFRRGHTPISEFEKQSDITKTSPDQILMVFPAKSDPLITKTIYEE